MSLPSGAVHQHLHIIGVRGGRRYGGDDAGEHGRGGQPN
jgi:hypothetical protein